MRSLLELSMLSDVIFVQISPDALVGSIAGSLYLCL